MSKKGIYIAIEYHMHDVEYKQKAPATISNIARLTKVLAMLRNNLSYATLTIGDTCFVLLDDQEANNES